MYVIFHGECWVLVLRTSPCPLEHINGKKKLRGKKREKSHFPIATYALIELLLLLFAGRGPAAGLFREQTISLPLPWSPWVTDADTGRKPTGGGCGDRMLIRMQIAAVNREPTDAYQGRSILEALDPQPSDLASLDLIVPYNPQRKYTPYTISTG